MQRPFALRRTTMPWTSSSTSANFAVVWRARTARHSAAERSATGYDETAPATAIGCEATSVSHRSRWRLRWSRIATNLSFSDAPCEFQQLECPSPHRARRAGATARRSTTRGGRSCRRRPSSSARATAGRRRAASSDPRTQAPGRTRRRRFLAPPSWTRAPRRRASPLTVTVATNGPLPLSAKATSLFSRRQYSRSKFAASSGSGPTSCFGRFLRRRPASASSSAAFPERGARGAPDGGQRLGLARAAFDGDARRPAAAVRAQKDLVAGLHCSTA